MEWRDSGIVLSTRAHGESSVIVELLTLAHGRHLGLVRGGRSRRLRATLQAGNEVQATWRARLDEHLGHYTIELQNARAATLMQDRARLAGLGTLVALAHLLPEREPVPGMVAHVAGALDLMMDALTPDAGWLAAVARFELALLDELGFGLDLSVCAATGQAHDLVFVSPKSGRAVSAGAGAPYADKMLPLPAFLIEPQATVDLNELARGFALTGYFLDIHVIAPRGLSFPHERQRLIRLVTASDVVDG